MRIMRIQDLNLEGATINDHGVPTDKEMRLS